MISFADVNKDIILITVITTVGLTALFAAVFYGCTHYNRRPEPRTDADDAIELSTIIVRSPAEAHRQERRSKQIALLRRSMRYSKEMVQTPSSPSYRTRTRNTEEDRKHKAVSITFSMARPYSHLHTELTLAHPEQAHVAIEMPKEM